MEKIIHIYDQYLPVPSGAGGASYAVQRLAKIQKEKGHQVYVLGPNGHSCNDFEYIKLPEEPTSIETILDCSGSILVYHGGLPESWESEIFSSGLPVVSFFHGCGEVPSQWVNPVFVSKSHADNHDGSKYLYHGIDLDEYEYQDQKGDYFLFLSKVKRSKKGVANAIAAAKRSKSKLTIAGGYRLSSIETWLPYHPRIRSVGYVQGQEKINLLKNAKALVFPVQWEEPFGLVIIEALACGTPVIGTKRGSLPELLDHGKTGYLCDTDEDIAKAMLRVSELSPKLCREVAEEKFSEDAMYNANISLYREAINGTKWR